jgi:hypothetical protein
LETSTAAIVLIHKTASTLPTLACPAGPWDEPVSGPVLGGSGPRWCGSGRLAMSRTAVDRGRCWCRVASSGLRPSRAPSFRLRPTTNRPG